MNGTQVLVIEDDEATATFLADNLHADGYGVWVVGTVGEALRAIERRGPDVALLDLGLDDGSGLKVLDFVRDADGLAGRIERQLPVIVLTAGAARSSGCADSAAAPTTTWSSRSAIPSSWRGCRP